MIWESEDLLMGHIQQMPSRVEVMPTNLSFMWRCVPGSSISGPGIFVSGLTKEIAMARKLILIRHEKIEDRFAGKLVGSTDVSLSSRGLADASRLFPLLSAQSIDVCYSSPKRRCRDTAYQATAGLGLMPVIEDDLSETDFGQWEGLSFAEAASRDSGRVDQWARFDLDFAFPEGERLADFIGRVTAVADRLAQQTADTVAVFTHGGVIRFMLCHLLGVDFEKYVAFSIRYGGVAMVALHEKKGVLEGLINPEVC